MRIPVLASVLLLAMTGPLADPAEAGEGAHVCDRVTSAVDPPPCRPGQLLGKERLTVVDRAARLGLPLHQAATCHAVEGREIAVNRRYLASARMHGAELPVALTTCRKGSTLYVLDDLRPVEVPSMRCPTDEVLHVHVPTAVAVPGWARRVLGAGKARFHSTRPRCGPSKHDSVRPRRGSEERGR
jgi:hypothetical protein